MKSLIAVLILGSAMLSPQAPPVGTVRGIVMSAGSNEPLPDVKIFLPIDGKPVAAAAREDAVSDAGGNFVIANVPVGRLILRAQLAGYFASAVDGVTPAALTVPVTVVADQTNDVRIAMVRGGSITGRILDRNGKPMQDVAVQPLTSTYVQGVLTSQPFGTDRITDDRGEYRLYNLAPGEYRVAAMPRGLAFRASTGVGASQEITIRTLYPDATNLANALPVVVRSGDEIGGIDIRMKIANTFRISGTVTSTLPAGPVLRQIASDFGAVGTVRPSGAEMALIPRDPTGLGDMILSIQANIKDDNTFEFRNVLPGAYEVVARLPVANGWGNGNPPGLALAPVAFGRTPVEVVDRSVENVNVAVHQGVDLNGVLFIDGKPASAAVRISLRSDSLGDRESNTAVYGPILDTMASYTPPIGQDGAFTIPLVPEASYRFQIVPGAPQLQSQSSRLTQPTVPVRTEQSGLRPLAATAYVSDVRQAGVSIYDNGLAVGAAPLAPIEILINTDAGSIQGIVVETNQKPVPAATIVLVPQAGRRQNPALYKTVRSEADGRFTLTPVPPGIYKLFASQSIPPGAYQNTEFISKYDERGTTVIVRSGQISAANLGLLNP